MTARALVRGVSGSKMLLWEKGSEWTAGARFHTETAGAGDGAAAEAEGG